MPKKPALTHAQEIASAANDVVNALAKHDTEYADHVLLAVAQMYGFKTIVHVSTASALLTGRRPQNLLEQAEMNKGVH